MTFKNILDFKLENAVISDDLFICQIQPPSLNDYIPYVFHEEGKALEIYMYHYIKVKLPMNTDKISSSENVYSGKFNLDVISPSRI